MSCLEGAFFMLLTGAATAQAAPPQTSGDSPAYAEVQSLLSGLDVLPGYYEYSAVMHLPPHDRTLNAAEEMKTLSSVALRALGEKHLREGEIRTSTYKLWYDGRRIAAHSIVPSLNVTKARIEMLSDREGLNDEYHWEACGGPTLTIKPPDAMPAAHVCYDARQKLWALMTAGLLLPTSTGDYTLASLAEIPRAAETSVRYNADIRAALKPNASITALIEADNQGRPRHILRTSHVWGKETDTTDYITSDWRTLEAGVRLPFHLEWVTKGNAGQFRTIVDLRLYRPLEPLDNLLMRTRSIPHPESRLTNSRVAPSTSGSKTDARIHPCASRPVNQLGQRSQQARQRLLRSIWQALR